MSEVLIENVDKCTGCRVCELVCSMAMYGEYNPKKSYIRVMRNRELDVNIVALDIRCNGCGKCVEWCWPGAIQFVSPEQAAIIRKENTPGVFPAPLVAKT